MNISITLIIIAVTCIVSFISFNNSEFKNQLIFFPPAISNNNQWYRFFSCGLIHQDWPHLIFNMYALYLFGEGQQHSGVEYIFISIFGAKGKIYYLTMYISALGICLLPTYGKNKNNRYYFSLGASGAVSAVVFASILFNPMLYMGIIFLPIFIPGFLFGALYLFISWWLDKNKSGNINHSAHIWGAIYGIGFSIACCYLFSHYNVIHYFMEETKQLNMNNLFRTP